MPGYRYIARRILSHRSEITLTEARFLGELVRRAPPELPIIEIGTLFGASTRVLAMFKRPETALITVDSFRWNPHGLTPAEHARVTAELLREAVTHQNVRLEQMDKADFYAGYSLGRPGLVFLDANHSYESTLQDIRWAQSVGSTIICGHDHCARFPGVMKAVAECGGASAVVDSLFVLNRV